MMGIEGGWIHRENKKEGVATTFNGVNGTTEKVDQYHVQVSAQVQLSRSRWARVTDRAAAFPRGHRPREVSMSGVVVRCFARGGRARPPCCC
jgi:hypothetical protein